MAKVNIKIEGQAYQVEAGLTILLLHNSIKWTCR